MRVRTGQRLTYRGWTFVVQRAHLRQVVRERRGGGHLITPSVVAREVETMVVHSLAHLAHINRRYAQDFSQARLRIGDTIQVRLPRRFTVPA